MLTLYGIDEAGKTIQTFTRGNRQFLIDAAEARLDDDTVTNWHYAVIVELVAEVIEAGACFRQSVVWHGHRKR